MRWFAMLQGMLVVLAIIVAGPVGAQDNVDQWPIRQVIEAQLSAFQKDDAGGAYGFASPTIQEKFVNPDVFLEMVKTGYPAVYRPREVEFRDLRSEGGRWYQDVFLVGPDGSPILAIYEMQRQPDGTWRINGCWLTKASDQSV